MSRPEIKIIAVSNVFSRLMHFKNAGDVEYGHTHTYDHATLVSSGSVRVDVTSTDGIESSKNFIAPTMIFVPKDKRHSLTALEDNTVCVCIHALRTIDDAIVSPEFLVSPMVSENKGEIKNEINKAYGQDMQPMVIFNSL
jgi:hypothetical protein